MANDEVHNKFMHETVLRINNLNERLKFLEQTITRVVNHLAKSDIKSPYETGYESVENRPYDAHVQEMCRQKV